MSSVTPQPAAALILLTPAGEVLVGERAATIRFLPRYVSVPGGKVESEDHVEAEALWPSAPLGAAMAAAVREVREECGLVVTDAGAIPEPAELRGRPLTETLSALGATLGPLAPAGRWITPSFSAIRFDTQFFLHRVPAPAPTVVSAELAWAEFRGLDALWRAYVELDMLLPPPFRAALELLQQQDATGPGAIGDLATQLAAVRGTASIDADPDRAEFHPDFEPVCGIRVLPLRTPTLPPAEHTNAYVVGHERLIVVDPAPYDEDERELLAALLSERIADGAMVDSVVLTHHHFDHMGAAMWIAERFSVPIRAHAITRDLLANKVSVDHLLEEGDTLDLGQDLAGRAFILEVAFTPGHAPGHIVLMDRRPGGTAMIVGDMVASIGTIIIDPPEGDMARYIAELRRLRERPNGVLFPAHGHPIVDGHAKLDEYVKHRLQREARVFDALEAKGEGTPADLVPLAYVGTPTHLFPLAERSCLAHLEKLVIDGRAIRDGARFALMNGKNRDSC